MKELTREQLIRRLNIIQGDVSDLYDLLGTMEVDTTDTSVKSGISVDTYITNIVIVCDIDENGIPTDTDGHRVESEWLSPKEIYKGL